MSTSSPLGFFMTWTVYGTFLPGDNRGWRHRDTGLCSPKPSLNRWHRERLSHEVVLLSPEMQQVVEDSIRELCTFRGWHLWGVNGRSNHVHVVLTVTGGDPEIVRDQLKSRCTLNLRKKYSVWQDRPIWTAKGDIQFLDSQSEIDRCVLYVVEAQDRKGRDDVR